MFGFCLLQYQPIEFSLRCSGLSTQAHVTKAERYQVHEIVFVDFKTFLKETLREYLLLNTRWAREALY